jgi:hypothetical protein
LSKFASKSKLQSISKIAKTRRAPSRTAQPRGPPRATRAPTPAPPGPKPRGSRRGRPKPRDAARGRGEPAQLAHLQPSPRTNSQYFDQAWHYFHTLGLCNNTLPRSRLYNGAVHDATPRMPAWGWPALVGYAGQWGVSTAYLRGRRSPGCRREARATILRPEARWRGFLAMAADRRGQRRRSGGQGLCESSQGG